MRPRLCQHPHWPQWSLRCRPIPFARLLIGRLFTTRLFTILLFTRLFFNTLFFCTVFFTTGLVTTQSFAASAAAAGETAFDQVGSGVILLYHHVDTSTPAVTSVSPARFAEQLKYLEQNGFSVWPLPRLVNTIESAMPGQPVPDKVVAITFDDNYRSVYSEAFPLLKQHNWPFTIFVSPDDIDKGINLQASWEQLREMGAAGATIANHTASHAHLLQRLTDESEQQWRNRVRNDIERAQRRISEETGQQHRLFAYPYGEYNRALASLVASMGYIGIGQHSGAYGKHHGGLAIPRFPVAGNYSELNDVALKLHTLPLPVSQVEAADVPLDFSAPPPTLTLTLIAGDYKPGTLQCFGTGQGALKLRWHEQWKVEVIPGKALPVGRSRFNCTLDSGRHSDGMKRFYWFSHQWIRADKNGHLPD